LIFDRYRHRRLRLHPSSFQRKKAISTMPSSDIASTRHSARQAAKTSSILVASSRKRTVPPPAPTKKKAATNKKKKARASTGSVANLPPRPNHRPGPPPAYPRRQSAPPAVDTALETLGVESPSSSEGDSTEVKVELRVSAKDQKLSAIEIYAYADAVAYKRTIGAIFTDEKGKAVVAPIKGDSKPAGSSLNDVSAWTSFALSDEADLFGEDTDAMNHDSGNKKANDKAKIGAFARFIRTIDEHEQLSPLARLIDDPEGGKVMRFVKLLRGTSTNIKMSLLNTLMLAWSYEFHKPKVSKQNVSSTYQPNYTDKVIRQIFKCIHDCGILICHSDFRSFVGSYWCYFKGRFCIAVQLRADFGRNPFRAAVEHDDEIKMRTQANPPLEVLTSFDDNLLVALYKVARDFMNRGGCEVCLLLLLFVLCTFLVCYLLCF
jgi:hypothetical protein